MRDVLPSIGVSTHRRPSSPVSLVSLGLALVIAASVEAGTAWRWQPDEVLNGQQHGARGEWQNLLWGLDFTTGRIWAFDGSTFHQAGRVPGHQKPLISMFTEDGMFVLASHQVDDSARAEILYSADGLQDFQVVLSVDSTSSGTPFAGGQDHSMVDLGDRQLMYFQYSDESRVFHSPDAGQTWNLLFQPEPGSIRHFHGAFYDADYQKLYVMSGDSNSQSSIMVADDILGEHGLVHDPALWRTRWGLDDVARTTLDDRFFLKPDGCYRSQRTRTVEMEVDGDYIYWGEDRASETGLSLFRANRETLQVEEVGRGDIIGAPWRFLKTSDDRFLFLTSSIHWSGNLAAGSDGFVHLYELNAERTDYQEWARFPERANAYSGGQPFGFAEAFGRLWINGYNITERQADIVGRLFSLRLGDFGGDGQLTVTDIDALSAAIRHDDPPPMFDLDLDGRVDATDRQIWVQDLAGTYFGDSNLDGEFTSGDLVQVFQVGEYEDGTTNNSTWAEGDWDGDGDFGTGDMSLAFQRGGYERGRRATQGDIVVPEPNGLLWETALLTCLCASRHRLRVWRTVTRQDFSQRLLAAR